MPYIRFSKFATEQAARGPRWHVLSSDEAKTRCGLVVEEMRVIGGHLNVRRECKPGYGRMCKRCAHSAQLAKR